MHYHINNAYANHNGVPRLINVHIATDTYVIGLCTEIAFSAYAGDGVIRPILSEIRYPQVYTPATYSEMLREQESELDQHLLDMEIARYELLASINQLLYDAAKSLIEKPDREWYSSYDITYATEDMISIFFYGVMEKYYPFCAITVDMRTGEVMRLENYVDADALTVERIMADYTKVHSNSFSTDSLTDSAKEQLVQEFLSNLDGGNNFFISDESENGVFIVLKMDRYYFIFGQ